MALDSAHSAHEPQTTLTFCTYCGKRFELGYYYTCHTCGATYCYVHVYKHHRAHVPSQKTEALVSSVG